MHHNNIRLLKAALFSIGAGAIVGGLWLGLSAWFDLRDGSLGQPHDFAGLLMQVGLLGGAIGGGLLSLIIILAKVRARAASGLGLVVGFLMFCWIAYGGDSYYTLSALILIPGGALIGAGTARVLGRA